MKTSAREAIISVATDYIESWLEGDTDRMRGCLHPDLAKRRVKEAAEGSLALHEVPFNDMVEDASYPKDAPRGHRVEVLDISNETASVKVTSAPIHRLPAYRSLRQPLAHRQCPLRAPASRMNSIERSELALIAASLGSGFAIAFGAVSGNFAILVAGIVLLVIGPLRTLSRRRRS